MITVGIDEVGRGCWAGPLVAAAVVWEDSPPNSVTLWEIGSPKGVVPDGVVLRDSKKMSQKQRETAAKWVQEHALAVGLGWVWPAELDNWGITTAVKRAMEWALQEALAALTGAATVPGRGASGGTALGPGYDQIIVDGNINYFADNPRAQAVIKADDSEPSVSAASIVAKVARDNYMAELAAQPGYVGYGFDKHVGYGTAAHVAALQELGVSDVHRRSYKPIKALLEATA